MRRCFLLLRVKVYRLNDDGKWDDQGTGHVTIDYLERSEELGLLVIDEVDNETLLMHRISPHDIYRKQEDTIISWRDPEFSTELALSFQETAGCSYIWDHISSLQRNLQFNNINNETFHGMNSELKEFPAVELSTLPLILKMVTESGIADQMRMTELIANDRDFFRMLMELFRICEDLENIDGLQMIFKIIKGIIFLNSSQIFEKIFGDDFILDIIGALEYDPEVSSVQHHRKFLSDHVVFKEAIPIKDPLVLSKIHQTYRVGYLKDVVLARVLDDATVATFNSIIHSNNAIVVSLLKDDNTFIQELFARLKSPTASAESKKNLVYFLFEFCSLSKSLQMVQQLRLFRDLMNEGIFDIITVALQSQDKKLVLTGTDILILFLNQDPDILRSYVVRQEGIPLFGLLVKGMITDFGEDMHCQFLEILRSLLDSYTLSGAQRDTIIEIFYEKHLDQLIDVIVASCPPNGIGPSVGRSGSSSEDVENQDYAMPEILSNICELLCFCVLHHPFRIKCNFLLNNTIDKVLLLTKRKEKYLVVSAVRFVRAILSCHEEHLVNHMVKNNLLKPIVDAFISNGDCYNLLHSAVLELFEYIRKENLKSLVRYIVDSFWNELVKFEYLGSIHSLKVKYEQVFSVDFLCIATALQVLLVLTNSKIQCLENVGAKSSVNASNSRKRIDDCALEKQEEDYFNEDSDEEDMAAVRNQKIQAHPSLSNGGTASLSPRSGGLVDYDDDEDDENYKPPPKKQQENSEDDEGTIETLRLKRKTASSTDKEPELVKKQRLGKTSKSRESVFAALCSTLSQAVLPSKKTSIMIQMAPRTVDGNMGSSESNHQEEEPVSSRNFSDNSSSSDEKNHIGKEPAARSCSDCAHKTPDNRQLVGEDSPLIPQKPSPEVAVNGSKGVS
ncbi:serine/threonine-protein phosphatase 4 regulatory subunit 3A-like isoform X2 [Tripterygium wilfordii]|uniref:serine/threonine-protein phosphatase 4 regulatory subunit 3A-like isoform X2 n=1 Tax=Tripterygium wilfordii TaxID=458696 RepID=UPI0018F84F7D|nr:serine/threonine-protein phosphatase 4 regulatory subunit 3A-like isoform X2 [Tripterygium wilfordii]XP_038720092.1 serine/threonine-protein phosphatase 4 regulatory subunit 3A-like isoform X2 [Tripterygium wilfordii]